MRASDIAKLLAGKVESVCTMLLPNGKRSGHEWRVGSITGEPGKSMGVHLTGEKSGVWLDGETGQSGDLIGLWMAVKSIDLGEACREAMSFLGIQEDRPRPPVERQWKRPTRDGVAKLSDAHATWLRDVRKLPDASLVAYKIASRGERIMFPSMLGDDLVFAKYRTTDKRFSADADCEPILFGWQAIRPEARAVVITEGECFPGNAQIMTRAGWVNLADYHGGEVAQYSGGDIQWVHPLARIEKHFSGEMLRYETRGYVSLTTPGHNLISIDHKGREYKHTADCGANSVADLIPRTGMLSGCGIALSDAQIQFCIAVSADAAIDVRKQTYGGGIARHMAAESRYARFGFKKQRKIDRLRQISEACELSVSDTEIAGGYRSMCMPLPDWVPGRILPWGWIANATLAQREMMLLELVHWDGNSVPNRDQTEYSSKYLKNAEWVQALAHSAGRVSSIIRRKNEHGEWFKVSILHSKKTTSWQSMKNKACRIPHDGLVYCVQVPSGALVIRQEEKITITGNCDAIAMHAYGAPALSVPTGAGSNGWIDREFDRLERFDTIFLCMDSDAAGQKAIPGIVERLGRERVKVVKLPGKDANDCLIRGVDAATIILALRDARTMDPSELRNVGEFEDDVWAEYSRVDDGLELPWKKTRDMIKLRDGEVSIWAGVNGHGKSAVVSHIAGFLACSGVKTCVASMEFRTSLWLMKMNRQISGVAEPTEMYSRHINQLLAQHMYAFDVAGASKASRILDVFAYARRRYEIKLFVIDNLTKCGFADDDYPGQKKFVEELTDFARTTGTHIMVVAHMKKGETEDKPAGKFNVKGSGGITDMADTLVEIWRNKPRERAVTAAKESGAPIDERFSDQADTRLLVLKQRATGIEPIINLWFDFPTTQFLSSREHNPRPMLDVRGLNFVA